MTRIIIYISAALLGLLLFLPFLMDNSKESPQIKEVAIVTKKIPHVQVETPDRSKQEDSYRKRERYFYQEYTCRAGRMDDEHACRIIALEQVKQQIISEFAAYLAVAEDAKQAHLTEEEILSFLPALGAVTITKSAWIKPAYSVKASLTLETRGTILSSYFPQNCRFGIVKCIESFRDDPGNVKQMNIVREHTVSLLDEITRMRRTAEDDPSTVTRDFYEKYLELIDELRALDWFARGKMSGLREYRIAINAFSKSIALKPDYADAYCNRAEIYVKQGKHKSALIDFDEAITLDPGNGYYYLKRGASYYYLEQYQQAIDDFNLALKLDPELAQVYHSRGKAHKSLGNYQEAINDFHDALVNNPENGNIYLDRGKCFYVIGRHNEAVQDFSKIINEDLLPAGFSSMILLYRGKAYFHMNEREKAEQDLSKAIEINQNSVEAYYYRGLIYKDEGSYNKALYDFTRAVKIKTDFADGYFSRASVYSKLGDEKHSIEDYKNAAQLGHKEAQEYLNKIGVTWQNIQI